MIVVHHLNDSRSQRILWLLEELGLPYEIKAYQRDAATRLAPPELTDVHPLGNPHYWLDPANGKRIARLFRDRHKDAGRDIALGRVLPAQKRLDARHAAIGA